MNPRLRTPCQKRRPDVRRRGAVTVMVMIIILLIAMISGSILQITLMQRRQVRKDLQQRQAAWLADTAEMRLRTRFAADQDFPGEVWNISADELHSKDAAKVEIRREETGRFRIIADYPDEPVHRNRVTRLIDIPLDEEP